MRERRRREKGRQKSGGHRDIDRGQADWRGCSQEERAEGMTGTTPWVRKILEAGLGVLVYNFTIIVFVCSCSYEALESDEEKGSDNESDVSKLLYA